MKALNEIRIRLNFKDMWKKTDKLKDLEAYQRLCDLHLEIYELTLAFPVFELSELGFELRRSSNSAPANIAEGWSEKRKQVFLEGVYKALSEVRQTNHHLTMAFKKSYIDELGYADLVSRYDECGRLLELLEKSLSQWKVNSTSFTKNNLPNNYYPQR